MILTASPGRKGTTHMPMDAASVFFVWIMNQAVPIRYSTAVPSAMNAGRRHWGPVSGLSAFTARPVISAQGR